MQKQYTRNQIQEAIKYWTRRLRLLDEDMSRTVQALIDKFGEDVVLSSEKNYVLTKNDLKSIYDILNVNLFENKLGQIRLEYWPEKFIIDKLNENAEKSEAYDEKVSSAPCYGVYSAACKDVKDNNGNIVDINLSNEIIMINSSYLKACIFIFAVASICHEMIHYYDRFSDEFHNNQLELSRSKKVFDAHKDNAFQEKLIEANNEGINVVERVSVNSTYDDINNKALFTLKKVIDESDNESTIIKTDHSLFLKGKGSSVSMIAFFD